MGASSTETSKGGDLMDFSFFQNALNTTSTDKIDLKTLFIRTRDGQYKKEIAKARYIYSEEGNSENYKKAKIDIPAVAISGVFKSRSIANIISHSGYICIDFDTKENFSNDKELLTTFDLLKNDLYTSFIAKSISNAGFMVIVKIDAIPTNEHQHMVFRQLEEYYQQTYELFSDPSCKDISRLRFISYDPDCYYNENAKLWKKKEIAPPKSVTKVRQNFNQKIYVKNDIHDLIEKIIDSGVNLTESYSEWLSIGFALHHEFGAIGETYFSRLSQCSSKFDAVKCKKQWDAITRHSASGSEVTIGTLVYYAKREGVEFFSNKNNRLIKYVMDLKKQGISRDLIPINAQKVLGDSFPIPLVQEVAQKVYESEFIAPPEGVSNVESIENYLKTNFDFRFNVVTSIPEILIENKWQIINERIDNFLWMDCSKNINNSIAKNQITQIINSKGFMAEIHPIKQELESLSQKYEFSQCYGEISKLCNIINQATDQETRVRFHPDSGLPYVHYFFTKWLICTVGQPYGNVNPHVIVLTGNHQGTNKTELWRSLLPNSLSGYYGETDFSGGKDELEKLEKYFIIMNDEWSGKKIKEMNFLKMLFSQNTLSMRKSYGRNVESFQRTASICATSNIESLLSDPTGNRRIIPIKIEKIMQRDEIKAVDKEKLWAEVFHLYNRHPMSEYDWNAYLDPNDVEFLNSATEQFKVDSLEEDKLEVSGMVPWSNSSQYQKISLTSTVIRGIIEYNMKMPLDPTFFSIALKKAGFIQNSKTKRIGGKVGRYYDLELTPKLQEQLKIIGYVGE